MNLSADSLPLKYFTVGRHYSPGQYVCSIYLSKCLTLK